MDVTTLMVGWGWTFDELQAGWQEIEALGYDACYLGDDLFPHYYEDDPAAAQEAVAVYDPWTVLPVMAATTKRMRIGSLVTPCGRRHPALFAKITTLVDIISEGRLTVSLGAGNAPDQTKACGLPFLTPRERVAMLEEEVRILDSLWTKSRTSFEGQYYQVRDLVHAPKPSRKPRPELQFGFSSPKFLTRLAAEFADRVNLFSGSDEEVQAAIDALHAHCRDFRRNPDEIVKTRAAIVTFTEKEVSEGERDDVIRARALEMKRDPEELLEEFRYALAYVGPPGGCAEALRERTEPLGIGELVVFPETIAENPYERTMAGLRTFASQVMPALQALPHSN